MNSSSGSSLSNKIMIIIKQFHIQPLNWGLSTGHFNPYQISTTKNCRMLLSLSTDYSSEDTINNFNYNIMADQVEKFGKNLVSYLPRLLSSLLMLIFLIMSPLDLAFGILNIILLLSHININSYYSI